MAEFKNYLNKFTYSDLTDIILNVINSYIEELKLKIFIYLLNQKKSKKILLDNLTGSIRSLNVLRNIY
jgi:glycopeptide antibiotics resistance protein